MDSTPTAAASAPVSEAPRLILYTRQGCCLCEGLEERLRELGLSTQGAAAPLALIDVDGDPELQNRYGLEVPVLAMRSGESGWRVLPRVPPRLGGERLMQWLVGQGVELSAAQEG